MYKDKALRPNVYAFSGGLSAEDKGRSCGKGRLGSL